MNERSVALGQQIRRWVVATTMASVLFTITAIYLIYGVLTRVAPSLISAPQEQWMPNGFEWIIIGSICLLATAIAAYAGSALARLIVAPIVSVADCARRIADGDLGARAYSDSKSLSEALMLVDDFNLLAERLERASEGVIRWNATIAHELRTPVTILRGRLQGLADGVFQPDAQLFRSLEAQATSLARLVDDLRTVTLFDSGQLRANLEETNLAGTVSSAIELMRPDARKAGFEIVARLEPICCKADGDRIQQALSALLDNSTKHARPGRIQVMLGRRADQVLLQVRDEGPGLPPDFEKHAFDAFRRYVEHGVVSSGSGLGLSVVLAIAELHGGTASYQTVEDGACFSISFPYR